MDRDMDRGRERERDGWKGYHYTISNGYYLQLPRIHRGYVQDRGGISRRMVGCKCRGIVNTRSGGILKGGIGMDGWTIFIV